MQSPTKISLSHYWSRDQGVLLLPSDAVGLLRARKRDPLSVHLHVGPVVHVEHLLRHALGELHVGAAEVEPLLLLLSVAHVQCKRLLDSDADFVLQQFLRDARQVMRDRQE